MAKRKRCALCNKTIPLFKIDGSPAVAGEDFWEENGKVWHNGHPLYENCLERQYTLDEYPIDFEDLIGEPIKYTDIESATLLDVERYYPGAAERFLTRKGVEH